MNPGSSSLGPLPPELEARLNMITHTIPRFWRDNRHHNHFTNHGPAHSERILNQKLVQLAQELPESSCLTADEIFVVSAAAWLYEIGMQSPDLGLLEMDFRPGDSLSFPQLQEIREKRHLLTERLIINSVCRDYSGPPLLLGLASPGDDYTQLIAEVCRWCSNETLEDVPKTLPINGLDVRVRLLVSLLRLADQLHINQTRVNLDLLKRAELPMRQFARWWAYQYVQTLPITKGQIRFHFYLPASQREYLAHIRILFEPDFEYDNNPNIRYLWDKYGVRLMPHRAPGATFDPPGFRREMGPELIKYLQREFTLSEELLDGLDQISEPASIKTLSHNNGGNMIKILFLAANPLDTNPLRLDEESRAIDESLRKAEFRDRFDIRPHWAVRVTDLQGYLLRHKPDIVHFSGHGSKSSEIILEDSTGTSQPISARALSTLFSILRDNIRCVVLNACYSELQAQAIAEHIDCVVGMSEVIGDAAAISFASAFYQALGYGRDVQTAFDLGCVQIDLESLEEQDIPKLVSKKGNPKNIVFVQAD